MFEGLYIGATGMRAQQANVDTIANNLANANTTGFKKSRVSFSELVTTPGLQANGNPLDATSSQLLMASAGVGVSSMSKSFEVGELRKTESMLDVAIQGEGFFEVLQQDGTSAYTRSGSLKVSKDNQLSLNGMILTPGIYVPDDAQQIEIDKEGRVSVRSSGQSASVEIGQLELVRFANQTGLKAQGEGIYLATESSGQPISIAHGTGDGSSVAQGYLESSNVKMLDEMVSLMIAQRAYEANVKVVQAADEMLGLVNSLRK